MNRGSSDTIEKSQCVWVKEGYMGISPLSMRPAHSGRAWCVGLALASKSPGG